MAEKKLCESLRLSSQELTRRALMLKQAGVISRQAGAASNYVINHRNGCRHQFADSIGGCSANYK